MLLLHICTSSAFIRRMSFLLIAALAISTSAFSCPLGYINYSLNNQCYTTTIDALNWYDARDRCEALGGVLATIDSLDVNNFIRSSFNASNIWLGYNDQKIEGVFEWQSGEVSGFTNWMRDQPDNFNNQDCAEMTPNGKWVDQNCSLYRVGVCQQSPTSLICPDGYTLSLYDSNCYKRAPTPSTWFDAKTNCQSEGGNLAVVTSMTLNTLIFDTFGGGDYRLWLGLNDIANEGVFVWDSGDTSSFRNWDSTQPDSSGGNENCVQMWFEGKWNDAWCYRVSESVFGHYGLCETFSVLAPSPTSTPSIPPTSSPTHLTKYSYAVLFNNQSVPLSDSNEALMTSFFKQQGMFPRENDSYLCRDIFSLLTLCKSFSRLDS